LEVNPGYKRTEVGVVPEDWDIARLDALVDQSRSIRYGIVQPGKFDPQGRYMIRGQDYSKGWVDSSDLFRVGAVIEERYRNARVKAGDLIITIVGAGTGHVDVVPDWLDGANLTQTTARIAIDPSKAGGEFCKLVLQSSVGKNQVAGYIKGAAQPGLNCRDIEKFLIPLPRSKDEQCAITATLSDAEALLGALDRLIAKKHDLKQATMQQLLTGQTRLPGFHGEWEIKPLGDLISHCFSGATPRRNRPDYYKGNIRWITSGELNYNVITDTAEKITSEAVANTNLAIVPKGTFLMAITGLEAEGTRGACGIVGEPSTTNQSCMAVFPTGELVADYLFHYYMLHGKSLALQYCQGTKQQSYTAKLVKQLPIALPPTTAEQTAVAAVLKDMDAELAMLEQRLDKTRALKQAMMQELLTGKTRLVSPEVSHA
jgi:type I restriction enzyme, S subunit